MNEEFLKEEQTEGEADESKEIQSEPNVEAPEQQFSESKETEDLPLTKKEINACRHKAEKRWYRRLCVLNLLIIIGALCVIIYFAQEDAPKTLEMESEVIADEEEVEDLVMYSVMIFVVMLGLPLIVNYQYQKIRLASIRITEKNFPDIYHRVQLYAKRMDMKKVPEVYIVQQDGILNAFSSFVVRKQYIEIYADVFEIAYREYQDLDAISFIIAHEMAHIKYKHSTFWYSIKIWFAEIVPILGSTASRAREYSCDRLAQKVTGLDGIEAMFVLMAGKHLYKMVDVEDYLEYAKTVRGFFVWCNNLVSTHPVMTKRILALKQGEGSGKLY